MRHFSPTLALTPAQARVWPCFGILCQSPTSVVADILGRARRAADAEAAGAGPVAAQQSAGARGRLRDDLLPGDAGHGPHQPAAAAGLPRLLPSDVDVLAVHGARWSITCMLQLVPQL
jgi:hypothetical protein